MARAEGKMRLIGANLRLRDEKANLCSSSIWLMCIGKVQSTKRLSTNAIPIPIPLLSLKIHFTRHPSHLSSLRL